MRDHDNTQNSLICKVLWWIGIVALTCAMLAAIGMAWYAWEYKLKEGIDEGKVVLVDQSNGQIVVGGRQTAGHGGLASAEISADRSTTSSDSGDQPLNMSNDPAALAQNSALSAGQDESNSKPAVAILVENVDFSKETMDAALHLPKMLALGVLPHTNEVGALISSATVAGFEVLFNLPMQPSNYPITEAAPNALLNNLSIAENILRMGIVLGKSSQIIGAYSAEDEIYTKTASNIAPMLAELKKRNLLFLYGGASNAELLRKANQEIGGGLLIANVQLDVANVAERIQDNFKKLEALAKEQGYAVGLMHARPLTIQVLHQWMAENDKNGVVLVPMSKLLKIQQAAEQKAVRAVANDAGTASAPAITSTTKNKAAQQ